MAIQQNKQAATSTAKKLKNQKPCIKCGCTSFNHVQATPDEIECFECAECGRDFITMAEFNMLAKLQPMAEKEKPKSRAERFSDSTGKISDAHSEFEELRDELQSWLDNMPENMQSGDKASRLQDAIDNLENIIGSCDEIEGTDVEFPGMMGGLYRPFKPPPHPCRRNRLHAGCALYIKIGRCCAVHKNHI